MWWFACNNVSRDTLNHALPEHGSFTSNAYRQFSERILAEPGIEPATSWSQVLCAAGCVIRLGVLTFLKQADIFPCLQYISLLKTLFEMEKLLLKNNLSFSHSIFYPFGELSAIFIKIVIVVC